jgi:hypothetical protein
MPNRLKEPHAVDPRKLDSGRWQARVTYYDPDTGKRRETSQSSLCRHKSPSCRYTGQFGDFLVRISSHTPLASPNNGETFIPTTTARDEPMPLIPSGETGSRKQEFPQTMATAFSGDKIMNRPKEPHSKYCERQSKHGKRWQGIVIDYDSETGQRRQTAQTFATEREAQSSPESLV